MEADNNITTTQGSKRAPTDEESSQPHKKPIPRNHFLPHSRRILTQHTWTAKVHCPRLYPFYVHVYKTVSGRMSILALF